MRVPFAVLIALAALSCSKPPPQVSDNTPPFVPPPPAPPSQHAPICAKPAEMQAIDVSALLTQLQVVTVACHTEDKYNALIPRLRPALLSNEKVLNEFFTRAYGKRAQQVHDDYITELANSQSQLGLKSGDQFCHFNTSILDEVGGLSSQKDLATYAENKPISEGAGGG